MANADKRGQDKTVIKVRVTPRSSQDLIAGYEDGIWRIRLRSPPVGGKANKALREFLARKLGISKGKVDIVSGRHSRLKSVRIEGLSRGDLSEILQNTN